MDLASCPAAGSHLLLWDTGSSISSQQSRDMAEQQLHFPCQLLPWLCPCSGAPGSEWMRRNTVPAAHCPDLCLALGTSASL